jgi:hypothetical protein
MSNNNENLIKLKNALSRLEEKSNVVYFLTYDTKNNPRASVKYIYDTVSTLKSNGLNAKILVEDKTYSGAEWLGDRYKDLDVVFMKDDRVEINIDDVIVIPEYYSNALEQLGSIKCTKVMLIQQKDYIYETLPIGSRWSDFGFDRVITTTQAAKKYINEVFPEMFTFIVPPIIDDIFKPSELPQKPIIAISCRDRVKHRKFISEFYLKYPQLRWVTFRDMVQMSYDDYAVALKECMVSLWVDDESTFGTFPLESMKCNVPVVGKIPTTEPDWLSENGMWTYDESKIVELLGTYVIAWLEGIELTDEVKIKMKETLLPYDKEITKGNVTTIFDSFNSKRIDVIKAAIENIKTEA